jgi:pimeloyl-ACP methyl ester carboxylesterase
MTNSLVKWTVRRTAAAVALALLSSVPAQARKLGSLDFQPCTLAPKFAADSGEALCSHLTVPEDPARPAGRTIDLAIAWIPARNEAAADPVFMIAGGPGQSALDTFPGIALAFEETLKKRNVILVDQRGTGASNPLECRDKKGEKTSAEEEQSIEKNREAVRGFTERCRDSLASKADLRFYGTTESIHDLDAVRVAIGASQIDLVGISYGTRVAQRYAFTYPGHTRTVVLDSVAPNEIFLTNDFARNLDDALAMLFKQCRNTPKCVERMGDPQANLSALLAKLRTAPVPVSYRDPMTGETRQELLTRGHVALIARMFAYVPLLASCLPLTLADAAQGRYEPLMAQSKLISGNLAESMAAGMQLSVICTEDADGLKDDPAYAGSVLGNELVDTLRAQCEVWPHGTRPAEFHKPLAGNVPVLVLEGELDPVTPPRYGEQVVKNLPKGRLLVLRGQGHNVIPIGCMPKLMARFFDTADARGLDAHCLDQLSYTPPFTDYNGWEP